MKHSTIALLISQRYKFSHKSLETLWLLVSFQRSADFSVKLGLGRKNTWKTFKTFHFVLIFCIKNHTYINHTIIYYFLLIYLFIYLFFYLPTYSLFLYLLRNLVEKWSLLLVIKIISIFYLSILLVYFKLLDVVLWSYHLEKVLHDSICRHFIRLLWLDQTALTGTWMWPFLNGTLL